MDSIIPSPQTTLGILLGASEWPHTNLSNSLAFARSAHKVRGYFLYSNYFGIRPENWLDLFDTHLSSPNEIDQVMGTFLQERILRMKQAGTPASDLLFYYIGHGMFAPGYDQAYHLAIRNTRENSLRSSAISMAALAETLKTNARRLRRFVILDCCFAAESYKYLQSAPDQAALQQTISAFEEKSTGSVFPGKGTALLCPSGNKVPSLLLLPDESGTMFSEAFIRALALGNTHQPEKTHLSLYDLKTVIEDTLEDLTDGNAPRPYVGTPDQSEGDVASVLLFPNPQSEIRKAEEERVYALLKEQARKVTEAKLILRAKGQLTATEVTVDSVRIKIESQQRVVILRAVEQPERYMFIWVAHAEAYAIAVQLQGTSRTSLPRPLFYDTMRDIIESIGGSVLSVIVSDIIDDVFYARIRIDAHDKQIEIDATPAGAIALALRCATPIFVATSVLEQAGTVISDTERNEREGKAVCEEG